MYRKKLTSCPIRNLKTKNRTESAITPLTNALKIRSERWDWSLGSSTLQSILFVLNKVTSQKRKKKYKFVPSPNVITNIDFTYYVKFYIHQANASYLCNWELEIDVHFFLFCFDSDV